MEESSKGSNGEGTSVPEIEMKDRSRSLGGEKLAYDMDLNVIEQYLKAGSLINEEWRDFVDKKITEDNYFIFIYFIMKFNEKFIPFIDEFVVKKLELKMDFGLMSEIVFQEKYQHYILLNALSQSINIGYKDFLNYVMRNHKEIPSAIVIRILENEDIDSIKYIIDNKLVLYDVENKNIFDQSKFPQIFFQKLDQVPETTNIKSKKNNFLTGKQLVYYLYKSNMFSDERRQYLIKELATVIHINEGDILPAIIKMKDQDLAEELIQDEIFVFNEETLLTGLIIALKFNQSRISFLLYQYSKVNINILKNKRLHRTLIRSLIEYPENIEVYLYLAKRLINYFSVADTIYMLSIIEQLSFHKSIEDCKFLRFVNPLKAFVLILELINLTKNITYQVKTKCDQLYEQFMKVCTTYIDESSDKKSLEAMFLDKDLENREVIVTIAENDFLYLMKNPVVEHFIAKTWNSTYSSQSAFYHTSTLFHVIKSENVSMIKDQLAKVPKRSPSEFKSFQEGFLIWNESIKIKYYNQIFLFLFLLIYFQLLNAQFMVSMAPKVEVGITLRQYVKVWLPELNEKFGGTNFTLTEINKYLTEQNMTFLAKYGQFIDADVISNLTQIANWTTTLFDGIEAIEENALLLNYSTYIYLYAVLNIFFRYIYTLKVTTKINIIDTQGFLDILIFIILMVRINYVDGKFLELFDFSKIDLYDDNIRKIYVFMMSGFFVCLWLKTIVFFKFSEKIGPLIRIFELILQSLVYFGILFVSEFFIFGCIGNLLFALDQTNQSYKTIGSAFLATFRATMNDFDFYDFHQDNTEIAFVFLCLHLVISGIILFNFLIAILSNVYEKFQESSILLFHQEIILKKTEFLPDKVYGALLLLPFPFNCLNLIVLPFYLCCTSRRKLKAINKFGLYVSYSPLYLIFMGVHSAVQCILFPVFFFKILYHVFFEVCNNKHILGQKSLTKCEKFKNSLYCLLILVLSPLIFIYCFVFDLIVYTRCVFQDEDADIIHFEEEELITPFILNKLCEIFDKTKTVEVLCDDLIQDFTQEMKLSNEKYDFRNVLLSANHKESMVLIREYSIFVKFINKMRLKNNYREGIVNKSLLTKLIESNINYCRIISMINKRNKSSNSKRSVSKVFPDDDLNGSNKRDLSMTVSQYIRYNETEADDEEENDIQDITELQAEMARSESSRRNIISFSKLPKNFYHRLYMINLKDIKNTMDMINSSANFHQVNQKIRADMKIMRKQLSILSLALNTKDKLFEQKKSRASVRKQRSSQLFNRLSFMKNLDSVPEELLIGANPENKKNSKRTNAHKSSVIMEDQE